MSLKGNTNKEKIWNFLLSKGFTEAGTAGLMGNLYAESALKPTNLQQSYEKKLGFTDESYTAAVDSGSYGNFVHDSAGYGLAQWTYWSRKENMLNFCKAAKKSIGDLEAQLEFLVKELSGYRSLYELLKTTDDIKTASDTVLTQYERPANMGDAVKKKRAGYGQTIYNECAGKITGNEQEESAMKYSRQKVVDLVNSWLGKNEADGSYKEIIDIYNTLPNDKLPRKTKMKYGWAWCACTWSALAVKLGYTEIMPVEISCYYLVENAKKMGVWQENDAYIPKPGDAMLYDWQDSGAGDNTGSPDHVGTIVEVNEAAGYIVVCEGNYSKSVKKRTIAINGKYIRGFITPKYTDDAVTPAPTVGTKDVETVAREVIAGTWGSGEARKTRLAAAGYDYATVQLRVNQILNGSAVKPKSEDQDQDQPTEKKVTSTEAAKGFDKKLAGTYKTTTGLYIRNGAGTNKKALAIIPKGTSVKCYGYYNTANGAKWLYIQVAIDGVLYTGYSHSGYLKK